MEAYQKRVIEEKADLCEKLEKLTGFQKAPLAEQRRLVRQTQIMQMYIDVLNERVEVFDLKPEVADALPSE